MDFLKFTPENKVLAQHFVAIWKAQRLKNIIEKKNLTGVFYRRTHQGVLFSIFEGVCFLR